PRSWMPNEASTRKRSSRKKTSGREQKRPVRPNREEGHAPARPRPGARSARRGLRSLHSIADPLRTGDPKDVVPLIPAIAGWINPPRAVPPPAAVVARQTSRCTAPSGATGTSLVPQLQPDHQPRRPGRHRLVEVGHARPTGNKCFHPLYDPF